MSRRDPPFPNPPPRRATLHDVAQLAGVSHITISRYFRHPEKLSPPTRERVREAVETLQYVPNAAARSLVEGRSDIVALLVPDFANPFFTTLARGVEDEARRRGYTLVLGNTDETLEQERQYLEAFISHQMTGLLLAPSVGSERHLARVLDRRIAVVLIDRLLPGIAADTVRADTRAGARRLVEHLVEQGYRRIALVGGDPELSSYHDRQGGYREGMRVAGLEEEVHPGRYSQQSGLEITERLIAARALPAAVVAANNRVAEGVLLSLRRHGIEVPREVAVASIDEIEPVGAIDPFLTTLRQPVFEMGRLAMRMLADRIHGSDHPPRDVSLPTELVVRRSTLAHGGA